MQLHRPEVLAEIERLEARLLVISFADLSYLTRWTEYYKENFLASAYTEAGQTTLLQDVYRHTRFAADPDREVYRRYGLGLNSYREVYGFKILRQYARWKTAGKPVELPSQDPLQRGGDFVVNRTGLLTLSHTGRNQSERPPVGDILAALAS